MKKYGVKVKTTHDMIIIDSKNLKIPDEECFGYNDHRIILSIAGLSLIYKEITIQGVEAVNKSFPRSITISFGSDPGSTENPWFCEVISMAPDSRSFTGWLAPR